MDRSWTPAERKALRQQARRQAKKSGDYEGELMRLGVEGDLRKEPKERPDRGA